MSLDSRKRILQEKQDQIKAECEKFSIQIGNIIGQSEKAVAKVSSLTNCEFLKSFTSVYEFLNKLHVKVLDANCMFELFALELHGDNDDKTDAKQLVSKCADDNSLITNLNLNTDNNSVKTDLNLIADNNLKTDLNLNAVENSLKINLNPNANKFVLRNKSSTSIDARSTTTSSSVSSEPKTALTINEKKKLFDSFFLKPQSGRKQKKTVHSDSSRESLKIVYANNNGAILPPKRDQESVNYMKLKERVEKRMRDREQEYCVQVPQVAIKPPKRPGHCSAVDTPSSDSREAEDTDKAVAKKVIEMRNATEPKEGDVCFVSCVNSPSDFYIQVVSEETALVDFVCDQIAEIVKDLPTYSTKSEAVADVCRYCVCFCAQMDAWYRAEVLNWLLDDGSGVLIRYVDHGYTETVPLDRIRGTCEYLCKLPKLACKCALAWVKPTEDAGGMWPQGSLDRFWQLVDPDANRLFTVSYVEAVGESLIVDLQCGRHGSVMGRMIESGAAAEEVPLEGAQHACNEHVHRQLTLAHQPPQEPPQELPEPMESEDEREWRGGRRPRQTRRPVFLQAFSEPELPQPGADVTVQVLNILDLRTYYAVVDPAAGTMRRLAALINSPAELRRLRQPEAIPALGQLVLAPHQGSYMRARVLDIVEYTNAVKLELFLVDLGATVTVDERLVRDIRGAHLDVPFQAVRCTLSNVLLRPAASQDQLEVAMDFLALNLLGKRTRARVVHNASVLGLLLYDEDGRDIGQQLITSGIVDRCCSPVAPGDDCRVLVD